MRTWQAGAAVLGLLLLGTDAVADLTLGPAELVQAGSGNLVVPGYSVPSFVRWDGDDLDDLIVGEGGGTALQGKVRVYVNVGTPTGPAFADHVYAQSSGSDLVVPASGCLGIFPRVVQWDGDGCKDLLAGLADGKVKIFRNVGTDADPHFDGGTFLTVGAPGAKTDISVGARATPIALDWNGDGKKDLLVGALDGKLRLYLNEGAADAPDFRTQQFVQNAGIDLVVPALRSSPAVLDLNHDGVKDLLTGNTEGQLLLYANTGSEQAPVFSGYVAVESDGAPIDLAATPRSRPFLCDWTADGDTDVLLGAGDGLVRLYQGSHGVGVPAIGAPARTGTAGLLAACPNPLASGTTVLFATTERTRVRISIYDAMGRRVADLANRVLDPGTHRVSWSGRTDGGRPVPAGAYFLRMEAEGSHDGGKLVVVR